MIEENRIYSELTSIKERLSAHTVIMNEILTPSIAKIEAHLTLQNGDMGNAKKDIIEIKTNCAAVQRGKDKSNATFWKILTAIITISGIILAITVKKANNKMPIELFYQVSDSTLHVPRMYFRDEKTQDLKEVSIDYFNIKK